MSKSNILIVDDNPSMRKLLGMALKQLGISRIDYAGNGIEAIRLHNANHYNIIVLDNAMPEMTGLEFLRTCHNSLVSSDTAVIMVTAVPDQEIINAVRCNEIRLHDLVVKPFDIQSMKDRVQKLIGRTQRSHQQNRTIFEGIAQKSDAQFTPNINGKTLSLGISVARNVTMISATGMFLNEDRGMISNFVRALPEIPGDTLLFDLSGVVGIDEFGLGSLLFVNGMAAAAGKTMYLVAENSMVFSRIKAAGIPEIVPLCDQRLGVPLEG